MGKVAGGSGGVDWQAERDRVDLVAVATRLLGEPPGPPGGAGKAALVALPLP